MSLNTVCSTDTHKYFPSLSYSRSLYTYIVEETRSLEHASALEMLLCALLLGRSSLLVCIGVLIDVLVLVKRVGLGSLQLQEQGRVFNFDEVVYVFETSLHQLHLRFDCIVPVRDARSHGLLRARQKLA